MNEWINEWNKWEFLDSHEFALYGYTGMETTCANEMNFGLNHAPDAGSITQLPQLPYGWSVYATNINNMDKTTQLLLSQPYQYTKKLPYTYAWYSPVYLMP